MKKGDSSEKMTGGNTRGTDDNGCGNCVTLMEMMAKMGDKMDQMTERFNHVETFLKAENEKLRDQLKMADKRYDDVCDKVNEMAIQINRLKQDNLSRNLLIKGVPELEKENDHLKGMVGTILQKLRFNFPLTFVDCYRIGRMRENTCRPIVVVLPNVNLKNVIIRVKRTTRMTCAQFSNDGVVWGPAENLIYIDEHLTRENYLLYMSARKMRQCGYKYVWTRNGRIFARLDEKSKVMSIESVAQINRLLFEAKGHAKSKDNSNDKGDEVPIGDEEPPEDDTDGNVRDTDVDENETEGDNYDEFQVNSPKKKQKKRKKVSPAGNGRNQPKRHAANYRKN